MQYDDSCAEVPANQSDWHDADRQGWSGEASEFDAAVVIMAAGRELMNIRIAVPQAGIDLAYRQLIDARADLTVASAHAEADVVAAAKGYVDEVEAMFERVSTVNVAEMTATIEQGLNNLEAAIALIPPAVDAPPTGRGEVDCDNGADPDES